MTQTSSGMESSMPFQNIASGSLWICKQATCVAQNNDLDVYTKHLADGSLAVGLFNRSYAGTTITASWRDLMIAGKQRVRNLWSQKDLGVFDTKFDAPVAPHGVVLLRLIPVQ